jgi:hypothetical protein
MDTRSLLCIAPQQTEGYPIPLENYKFIYMMYHQHMWILVSQVKSSMSKIHISEIIIWMQGFHYALFHTKLVEYIYS